MIAATAGTANTGVTTWAAGTGVSAFRTLAGAQGWNIPMKIGEVPQGVLVIRRDRFLAAVSSPISLMLSLPCASGAALRTRCRRSPSWPLGRFRLPESSQNAFCNFQLIELLLELRAHFGDALRYRNS